MKKIIILIVLLALSTTSWAFDSAYSGAQVDAEIARGIGRNTIIADPGSDAELVTEQAVREALDLKSDLAGDTYSGAHDYSAATVEMPNSDTLPGTCTVGQAYMDTNATTGQRWYLCETTNNWVLQGGAGGAGTVDTSGTPVANDFAKFTDADTIEGRSYTETRQDLSLDASPSFTTNVTTPQVTITGSDASPDASGELRYDSTISTLSGGGLRWYDDDSVRVIVDLETDPTDDDYVVAYDSAADGFYMKVDAGSGAAGTLTTIKENDVGVGGADIVTLDFLGADFDLAETPDTEVQVIINADIARVADVDMEMLNDVTGEGNTSYLMQDDGDGTYSFVNSIGVTIGGFTASRALETDVSGNLEVSAVTDTELNYLDGVTSALQTQLDAKEDTLTNEAGLYLALSDVTQFIEAGDTVTLLDGSNWSTSYTNGTGDVTELAIGAVGTYLYSNGVAAAPSWATPSGSGDVTAAAVMTDDTLVRGDGGAKGVQDTGITVDESDNVASMGTLGCGAITSTGAISGTTGTFTGTLSGELGVTLDTDPTVDLSTVSNARGAMRINNDADVIDYTLPPAEVGLNICFYSRYANVVTVDVDDSADTIILDGTALTAGYAIDSPGTVGDFICLLCIDATYWLTLGRSGTWIDGGAD